MPAPLATGGKKLGFQHAGWFGRLTYSFVDPLLALGVRGDIQESTAAAFLPDADRAETLAAQFDTLYTAAKASPAAAAASPASLVWLAYWRLYRWRLAEHLAWCLLEIGSRVASPLLLRQLLSWFTRAAAPGGAPSGQGWMWAALLALSSYTYVAFHHQLFFRGMRMGLDMRVQAIAAVQGKVLRLNAAGVADVSAGKLVNLVSNDVRRFDEAATFWVFLIGGPLELILVLVLVGLRLGFAASVAGSATLLLLIPTQAALARHIGRLRHRTAAQTDERVRLTGEAVAGILACKMLAWEDKLLAQVKAIRRREASHIRRMNYIRALNMSLSYAITPLTSLVTFAVARATGVELSVANVFYALALLSLPKLYMCDFFTHAVEATAELRVSVRRLAALLALPEPPAPTWHDASEGSARMRANGTDASRREGGSDGDDDVVIEVAGADFDWSDRSWEAGDGEEGSTAPAGSPRRSSLDEPAAPAVPAAAELAGIQVVGAAADHPQAVSADLAGVLRPPTPPPGPTLRALTLRVRRGELVAIVGAVGSGKSSLLSALLGELQPVHAYPGGSRSGRRAVRVQGSVAYCQQVPWIVGGTVRDNVLFGLPYEPTRYAAVLRACALDEDLAAMPAGDLTEIGERGISVSGGQKARLALARAAYSGAAVQLLDDPLSAVDPRVGRVLFERCISGVMGRATRVLVTHQRQYLPHCDRVIVLAGGAVVAEGTYAELAAAGVQEVVGSGGQDEAELDDSTYDEAAAADAVREDADEEEAPAALPGESPGSGVNGSAQRGDGAVALQAVAALPAAASRRRLKPSSSYLRRFISTRVEARPTAGLDASSAANGDEEAPPPRPGKPSALPRGKSGALVVAEDRIEGGVEWGVYGSLLRRMGLLPSALVAAGLLGGQAVYLYSDYWLAQWASKTPAVQHQAYWVWGYAIMAGSVLLISVARAFLFFGASLRAATALHNDAAAAVLRAPLSFFHTNPTGRVLNRFSKDQGAIDEQLPQVAFDAVQAMMMVVGAFVLLVVVVPFILPIFLPLGLAFWWVQRRYMRTSRELKRYDAVTRSPLFSTFSATLKGLPTIRAYAAAARFRAAFLRLLTANGAWWFCWITTARWIGFRLDLLVAVVLTVAPLLMVAVHDRLSPRLLGLALTQSLQLAGMLQWMMRQMAEVENNMTSVERVLHYCHELEQEEATVAQGGEAPPPGWPPAGEIQYDDVAAVYRPGLPPVLQGLTFTVPGGTSCGVVGRTGSGKSSLMLTLFRLIPVTHGSITLDGVDTSRLGLDALRRQVAIIPQDPVLFSGTLRSNLDPWGSFGDAQLWAALALAQLRPAVEALGGLDSRVQECGDNLSAGQRQLLCLARALLQDAAVLALDEATANVDRQTDEVIQRAVRAACAGGSGSGRRRTLLVIAHRIDTIMDCDKVLVLSAGRLVESGPPGELTQGGGAFAGMVRAARAAAGRPPSPAPGGTP